MRIKSSLSVVPCLCGLAVFLAPAFPLRADEGDSSEPVESSASESSSEETSIESKLRKLKQNGVRISASASASGMANGRSSSNGNSSSSGNGPQNLNNRNNSNSASMARSEVAISINTGESDELPLDKSERPYIPGGPGESPVDDAAVTTRLIGGRRITSVEREQESIRITDSPTRIVVHRIDRSVEPPTSEFVAAASPQSLAGKDPVAYDLYRRYVLERAGNGKAATAGMQRSVGGQAGAAGGGLGGGGAGGLLERMRAAAGGDMERMLNEAFPDNQ